MQRVTLITGLRQEGKTTELRNEFLEHLFNMDKSTGKLIRESIKPIFINCDGAETKSEELAFTSMKDYVTSNNLDGSLSAEDCNELIVRLVNNHHFTVSHYMEFLDLIEECVKDMDCVFYIDNVEFIPDLSADRIIALVNHYPNQECLNSFDIMYTKLRDKRVSPELKWSIILENGSRHREETLDAIVTFVEKNEIDKMSTLVYLESAPNTFITIPNPFGLYKRNGGKWIISN